jgi:hypothetical protein
MQFIRITYPGSAGTKKMSIDPAICTVIFAKPRCGGILHPEIYIEISCGYISLI